MTSRARALRHLGATSLGLAMTLVVALGIGLGRPGVVSAASKYDHFLFVRHDEVEGQPGGSDTLVMARVTPEGFQFKDLYSQSNLRGN